MPAVLVVMTAVVLATPGRDDGAPVPEDTLRDGLARAQSGMFAPCAYEGTRRLEAEARNRTGWVEVATRYSPAAGFSYRVVAEGGSNDIRRRALLKVLDTEVRASRDADGRPPTVFDYQFGPPSLGGNVLRVPLTPKRRAPTLISGWFVLGPDGEPRTLEGQLARSPSFWVKSVTAKWTFGRVGSGVLPLRVDSVADVRFVGPSRFTMTYRYDAVAGEKVAQEGY